MENITLKQAQSELGKLAARVRWGSIEPQDKLRMVELSKFVWSSRASSDEEKFWRHVTPLGKDECWEWNGSRCSKGYGQFNSMHHYKAHRFSFELHFGKIPDGKQICHKCDNPPCVNPNHLWDGTPRENTIDSVKKGRFVSSKKGANHAQKRFTHEEALNIKQRLINGEKASKIAEEVGRPESTIRSIKGGHTWVHILETAVS